MEEEAAGAVDAEEVVWDDGKHLVSVLLARSAAASARPPAASSPFLRRLSSVRVT